MTMPDPDMKFPEGLEPLGDRSFRFACHPGVACFTRCCRKLDLRLYPYDIIRLKRRLGVDSGTFLERHAGVVPGGNPFFPGVILRMRSDAENACPFLDGGRGCSVYEDRPSACRTYPLERAVPRRQVRGGPREFYFMTRHDYCLGHTEDRTWTVAQWVEDQKLRPYTIMDDLWAEMDTLFASNPWRGEGAAGPLQQLAFMVCYNIDAFRATTREQGLFGRMKLSRREVRELESDDEALLRFGFRWLAGVLGASPGR